MRRVINTFLLTAMSIWLSISASAAPTALVPVGRCVGIVLDTAGVTVVGFADGHSPAREAGLRVGDRILAVNDTPVENPAEIRKLLHAGEQVVLHVQRNERENSFSVSLPEQPELGVLVRDGISGIGTVTFIDPQTGLFGALGHGVSEGGDQEPQIREGQILSAEVVEVVPGRPGQPGTLRGAYNDVILGQIEHNTDAGVFGYGTLEQDAQALPLGEALPGSATILANITGGEVTEYTVELLDVDASAPTRNLLVQVTDQRLLEQTGGIVQGMSGSPILQSGCLVGAVTHVLVSDPTMGYGIMIGNMLDAAA